MNVLIVKLNATGDVVRTTPLLHRLEGSVTWVTADRNVPLLHGLRPNLRCVPWSRRDEALDAAYDLVISLEDDAETARFVQATRHRQLFGAYLDGDGGVCYSDESRAWFDMSLISRFGRQRADELKYRNRTTYQELVFGGLGYRFDGDPYLLPQPVSTRSCGDVAIAPVAGPVWPMKNWIHYEALKRRLEGEGLCVNVLPQRDCLLEHLGDIAGHRCLVGGDSLPMHLALGVGTQCVTLFNCTSPWEIHDYGLQTKIVSPLLGEYFYKRGLDPRATAAITLDEVFDAVMARVGMTAALSHG